jgi:hypothetical protein
MNWNDDEIWDEQQWEAYINEVEQKTELLRKLLEANTDTELPRWMKLLRDNLSEHDAVDAYIEEELSLEDVYYPDDEDDDWEDEDEFDDEFWFDSDELEDMNDWEDEEDLDWLFSDEDDFDEGEWWKSESQDFTYSDYGNIENLSIYTDAHELSVGVLRWAQQIDESTKNPVLKAFIDNLLQIGAKLAAGYAFGFDQDVLGANIVYTRKALDLANRSLDLLIRLKKASFMQQQVYYHLHGQLFELRNDVGIYLQDLRERFQLGLE